jgi:hypothetical protein
MWPGIAQHQITVVRRASHSESRPATLCEPEARSGQHGRSTGSTLRLRDLLPLWCAGESLTNFDGESTKGILLQPPAPWIDGVLRLSLSRHDLFGSDQGFQGAGLRLDWNTPIGVGFHSHSRSSNCPFVMVAVYELRPNCVSAGADANTSLIRQRRRLDQPIQTILTQRARRKTPIIQRSDPSSTARIFPWTG